MGPLITISPIVTEVLLASLAILLLLVGINAFRGFVLFLVNRVGLEPDMDPERPPRRSRQSRK